MKKIEFKWFNLSGLSCRHWACESLLGGVIWLNEEILITVFWIDFSLCSIKSHFKLFELLSPTHPGLFVAMYVIDKHRCDQKQ